MAEQQVYSDADAADRAREILRDWEVIDGWLCRTYRLKGFQRGAILTGAIAHLAEQANHHPEITLKFGSVAVRLRTHSARAITPQDFALAAMIETLAEWRPSTETVGKNAPVAEGRI